ncbi:ABC transporter substrate-binding protein [Dactylosporangium sp. CA-233914]|uniref:ABC transporter substrate-binding protein n=1 Tax=Dactylosporangium sp. CA-233914 TaxID=3239934 RepID=UPI003D9433DD
MPTYGPVPGTHTRRGFLGLLSSGAAATLLAACGGGSGSGSGGSGGGGKQTLLVPNYATVTAPVNAAFADIAGLPEVEVELASGSNWPDVDTRLQQDITAGRVPEIAMVGINMLPYYHANKIAQPLDELLPAAGFDAGAFDPAILAAGRIDGKLVGVPWGVSTMTLFYNKDIFRAAGLDPDQPPRTFSQLREYSERIVTAKAARYGVATSLMQSSGNWVFQNYLLSNGGSMINADGTKITFNETPGVQVLEYWAKLVADKLSMPGTLQQIDDALTRRDLAMVLNPSSVRTLISKSLGASLAAAPMPVPDGGQPRTPPGGGALVIITKDKAKQQQAATVLAALLGPQAQGQMVTTSGYLPVNSEAARKAAADPLVAPSVAELKTLVPWQNFPGNNANQINKLLDDAITAALLGKKSAKAALDEAASAGAALLPK